METSALGVKGRQATNGDKKQKIAERARITLAAMRASQKTAPAFLRSDFNDLWVVRLLMTIRTGKRPPRSRVPGDLHQRFQGTGFVILDEVPNEEFVIGVAGRFWRPDGGRCLDLTADDFGEFSRPGYAALQTG
jgi:hypothetical protein